MDEQLKALLIPDPGSTAPGSTAGQKPADMFVRILGDTSDDVEVLRSEDDPSPQRCTLKPIAALYGSGTPDIAVDPQDELFLPLFTSIEEEFVRSHRADPSVTDADALLALDLLSMNPDASVQHHVLARRVQLSLRLCLSLNDYSRQEVRQALRKIAKSVQRHTSLGGRRGYLTFIRQYVRI